jgi:acyl-CoA thioester hydrolase
MTDPASPPASGREPVRYERAFAVEASDIDERGHVNNVVYLRWVQEIAAAHWETTVPAPERAELAWVVLRHEIEYRHAAVAGDGVIVCTWVGPATAARFERHTEILRASDRRVLARARSVWCPVDARTGRPQRVDAALNARFYR